MSLSKVTSGVTSFFSNVGDRVKTNFKGMSTVEKVGFIAGPAICAAASAATAVAVHAGFFTSPIGPVTAGIAVAVAVVAGLAGLALFSFGFLTKSKTKQPVAQPSVFQRMVQTSKKALNTATTTASEAVRKTTKFVKTHPKKVVAGLIGLYAANALRVNYGLQKSNLSRQTRLSLAAQAMGINAKEKALNGVAAVVDTGLRAKNAPITQKVANAVFDTGYEAVANAYNAIMSRVDARVQARQPA